MDLLDGPTSEVSPNELSKQYRVTDHNDLGVEEERERANESTFGDAILDIFTLPPLLTPIPKGGDDVDSPSEQ